MAAPIVDDFPALLEVARRRALRVVRDPTLADEVAHDTLVELHAGGRADPSCGSVAALTATVAARRAVDRVRAEQARRDRQDRHAALAGVPDDGPEEVVLRADVCRQVRATVAALPPLQAEAIGLTWFGGLTYVQAAEQLGVPEGTFKARAASAMRLLRQALG